MCIYVSNKEAVSNSSHLLVTSLHEPAARRGPRYTTRWLPFLIRLWNTKGPPESGPFCCYVENLTLPIK